MQLAPLICVIVASMASKVFDMLEHVVRLQRLTNQKQAPDDRANRRALGSVDNSPVGASDRVQAQKVCILGDDGPTFPKGKGQMFIVAGPAQLCFLRGQDIYPATAQALGDSPGNVLIQMKGNLLSRDAGSSAWKGFAGGARGQTPRRRESPRQFPLANRGHKEAHRKGYNAELPELRRRSAAPS